MDPEVEMTVEKIHSSTMRLVLYLGGGASQVGAGGGGRWAAAAWRQLAGACSLHMWLA